MIQSRLRLIILICLVMGMFMGAIVAGMAMIVRDPLRAQADAVLESGNYTLLAQNGISETITGTNYYVQSWGQADCYSAYIASQGYASMTVKLQHSSDSLRWVDLLSFPYQPLTGTQFTRTLLYGTYLRAISTVSSTVTAPMTYTVRCVAKNTN